MASIFDTPAYFDNFFETFHAAVRAITVDDDRRWACGVMRPHGWFVHQQSIHKLHPLVAKLVYENQRPIDWQRMLLEWPHVSTEDDNMLAYTRSEMHGRDDVQTRTTVGKYLSRHYPHVPDHMRRDWGALFTPSSCEIWDTQELIIAGVELGPQSCMKSSYGSIPFTVSDNVKLCAWRAGDLPAEEVPWRRHPYSVYDPSLGWRMAVRLEKGKPQVVMGRALVNVSPMYVTGDVKGMFVRSYRRGESDSDYSHTDEKLEAWLRSQGYIKGSQWEEGTRFLYTMHPLYDRVMMPYLDGNIRTVTLVRNAGGRTTLEISEDGEFGCDNTNGCADENSHGELLGTCDDCGANVWEEDEDRIWAGPHEDRCVCGECSGNYRWGIGEGARRNIEYYICSDNAVRVNGVWIDTENMPEGYVCCEDEEYREESDCVEIDGEWYWEGDDRVVTCEDDDERRIENVGCWQSAQGLWYSDDTPKCSVDGVYTPDELRDIADNA